MDTNVLLAGLRSRLGASHELMRLLNRQKWTLVLINTVLTEYQEVLHREQGALPYTHDEIERLLDGLCLQAEKRQLRSRWWPVLSDADDEAMVHLAVESRAEYLVTHNVRHLRPASAFGLSVALLAALLNEYPSAQGALPGNVSCEHKTYSSFIGLQVLHVENHTTKILESIGKFRCLCNC